MMQFVSLGITVIGFILKYGPTLWSIGVKVYGLVESMKDEWKEKYPNKTKEEIKEMADTTFDQNVIAFSAMREVDPIPGTVTRTQLRRDVWSSRKANNKKVFSGKTAGRKRSKG